MRIILLILVLILLACIISMFSCKQPDKTCTLAAISGDVKHHSVKIPYGRVFLKKGAIDAPGSDSTLYDIRMQSDAAAHYTISNLEAGNYYAFGYGYDTSLNGPVKGGFSFNIPCEEAAKTYSYDVYVVEF